MSHRALPRIVHGFRPYAGCPLYLRLTLKSNHPHLCSSGLAWQRIYAPAGLASGPRPTDTAVRGSADPPAGPHTDLTFRPVQKCPRSGPLWPQMRSMCRRFGTFPVPWRRFVRVLAHQPRRPTAGVPPIGIARTAYEPPEKTRIPRNITPELQTIAQQIAYTSEI